MNPFVQLIGPSFIVHVCVLLIGRHFTAIRSYIPFDRSQRAVMRIFSFFIIFVVAWMVSFIAMVIVAMGLMDQYSNYALIKHFFTDAPDEVTTTAQTTWFHWKFLYAFLPIILAAVGAEIHQMSLQNWRFFRKDVPPVVHLQAH